MVTEPIEEDDRTRTVTASRFELVDKDGLCRAILTNTSRGTSAPSPSLTLFGPSGEPRVIVAISDEGPTVSLIATDGSIVQNSVWPTADRTSSPQARTCSFCRTYTAEPRAASHARLQRAAWRRSEGGNRRVSVVWTVRLDWFDEVVYVSRCPLAGWHDVLVAWIDADGDTKVFTWSARHRKGVRMGHLGRQNRAAPAKPD
jgi:hypothetical protein